MDSTPHVCSTSPGKPLGAHNSEFPKPSSPWHSQKMPKIHYHLSHGMTHPEDEDKTTTPNLVGSSTLQWLGQGSAS